MSIFYPSRRDRGCAKGNRGCLTCYIKFLQKKNSKDVGIGIVVLFQASFVCRKKSVRKSGEGRGPSLLAPNDKFDAISYNIDTMASLALAGRYVVVTTQYPTSYGCHRGKRWSRAESICSGYYELSCSCEYPTKAAANEAAALARNQHDHFEDSEEHWEANPLPPFNSGSLRNYANDEEVKIEVMTPDEYSQRVAGDEACLISMLENVQCVLTKQNESMQRSNLQSQDAVITTSPRETVW